MNQPIASPRTEAPGELLEVSHDLPLVSFSVGTRSGALFDAPEYDGLTRVAARLMRRTGGGRQASDMDTEIDSLGGSLSADVSHSATLFHGTVIRRSLDRFVAILGDVLARPGLDEEELGRLVRETEAELVEGLDDDRGLCRRWFRYKLYEGHPYGRPVSGIAASLRRITREAVLGRVRELTARNGLVFAFSGDLEADEARRIADGVRSALPASDTPLDATPEPGFGAGAGRRLVLVDKPERSQTQILIGGTGTHPHDSDHTALLVGNTIFGGTFTARLTQEVRSKRGWSYGAYSSLSVDRRRQGFSMWTFPKAEDAANCIRLELDLLHALRDTGVTKKELAWAKRYLVRSHAFAIDTASKRVGLELDTLLYDLPADYYSRYLERIANVTLDEVNAALRARLPESDLLIVVVGTAENIRSAIEGAIGDAASVEVVKYDVEV